MPGSTDNSTILEGINQVIQAVNDLELSAAGTVDIVAKLEEIRTLYETESLAGIVAQNTNFSDLIDAISALTLSCQTIVNTTTLHQTINAGGGCAGPGQYIPTPPALPGDPPTGPGAPPPGTGFIVPPAVILDRKCKFANAFHENIKQMVTVWDNHAADNVASQLGQGGIIGFMTLLGAWVGELTTVVPLIDATVGAVIGWLIGIALKLYGGDFDLPRMAGILNDPDNQVDFICAAYEPPGSESIVQAYLTVASDKGMVPADIVLLGSIVTVDLANYAWYGREQYIEDALAAYEPEYDCSDCEAPETGPYTFLMGTETSEHPSNPIMAITVYNVDRAGCGTNVREIQINFHQAVTITNILVVGNGPGACGGNLIYNYYSQENFVTLISNGNGRPQDTTPPVGVRSLILIYHDDGNSPSVTITYTVD